MTKLLIVFCKNPQLGKVKTRLARTLGDDAALAIYYKLLQHTRVVAEKVQADVAVYYSDYVDHEDDWNENYIKKLQHGDDIGDKMYHAIAEGLGMGYEAVCLVGADIYTLTPEIIDHAFNVLQEKDVVLGPATDGGYYLIGMNSPAREVFQLSQWSCPTVLKETLHRVKALSWNFGLVDELNDIDEVSDLEGTGLAQVVNMLKP